MATFTGAAIAIDMREFDISDNAITEEDIYALSDTQFTVQSTDNFDYIYTGTSFVDNDADDIPDSGNLDSWNVTFDDEQMFLLDGLGLTWEQYWGFVDIGNTDGFLNAVFGASDTVTGSSADDYLFALGGNDTLIGLGGKDNLDGGKGKDDLDGGGNRDKLNGGGSQDTLTGGGGADRFIFNKAKDTAVGTNRHDIVTDYSSSQGDVLDLRKVNDDANFHLGGDAFTNSAGEIIVFDGVGATVVQGDTDGDGDADFEIYLTNSPPTGEVSILF